jgi:hypothetical protein
LAFAGGRVFGVRIEYSTVEMRQRRQAPATALYCYHPAGGAPNNHLVCFEILLYFFANCDFISFSNLPRSLNPFCTFRLPITRAIVVTGHKTISNTPFENEDDSFEEADEPPSTGSFMGPRRETLRPAEIPTGIP